jgi:hypothetical protein
LNKVLTPPRAYALAIWDFAKALGQIPLWLGASERPEAEVNIPADYIGINIATSDDPAVDEYLLARLAELGI